MSEEQFTNLKLWLGEKFDNNEKQHTEITDHLKKLNHGQLKNTEFRLRTQGGRAAIKWVLGFLGISNVAMIIKLFA